MGGTPPYKIIKQIVKNNQKGAGRGAWGQPDPWVGSRDAGAGGIPFWTIFDLFAHFVWGFPQKIFYGGGYPP